MPGMGNSFTCLYAKKYQHRMRFDRVIEKMKRVQFFLPRRDLVIPKYKSLNYVFQSFISLRYMINFFALTDDSN